FPCCPLSKLRKYRPITTEKNKFIAANIFPSKALPPLLIKLCCVLTWYFYYAYRSNFYPITLLGTISIHNRSLIGSYLYLRLFKILILFFLWSSSFPFGLFGPL